MSIKIEHETFGVELEIPFTRLDGESHSVSADYFQTLQTLKGERGEETHLKKLGSAIIGIETPYGEESLDNGFNLGESATGPVGSLAELWSIVRTEIGDVINALEQEGAGILNMANHPLTYVNESTYQRNVAPKPIYPYLREYRRWHHEAGIDAKAQNSPSVGVPFERAAEAVNAIIGFGAAFIGIYANSPFEGGKPTGSQESRLEIWPRMFADPRFKGDQRVARPPERPFANMRDYFQWMFGPDTAMYFVVEGGYKGGGEMIVIDDNQSVLQFLQKDKWQGRVYGTNEVRTIKPNIHHLALHQFAQFTGARIRFGVSDDITVEEFNDAMAGSGDEVEKLFVEKAPYCYIEGRDAGANFADTELAAMGTDIAASVAISPTALQAGILRNLDRATEILQHYDWQTLIGLREAAIKNGLKGEYNGVSVQSLAEEMLNIARGGLRQEELWMLAYPEFVVTSGKSGAVRALEQYEKLQGSPTERIGNILVSRIAIDPRTI